MSKIYKGMSRAPGTCGELLQGFDRDNNPFHITLPINRYTETEVLIHICDNDEIIIIGNLGEKTKRAIRRACEYCGLAGAFIYVHQRSDIPVGKGMASSTSNILAAASAVFEAMGFAVSSAQLNQICIGIESSDGIAYAGMSAVNQQSGQLLAQMTQLPPFSVLVIEPHSTVITNQVTLSSRHKQRQHALLETMRNASLDLRTISDVATKSAALNQCDNPNPLYDKFSPVYRTFGALGLAVGHTGSVLGLIYDSEHKAFQSMQLMKESRFINDNEITLHVCQTEYERQWELLQTPRLQG